MRRSTIIIVTLSLLVNGLVYAQDRYSCDAIIANIETNNAKVQQLASEKGLKIKETVLSRFPNLPVASFILDGKSVDQNIAVLYRRQHYLANLAEDRRCGSSAH